MGREAGSWCVCPVPTGPRVGHLYIYPALALPLASRKMVLDIIWCLVGVEQYFPTCGSRPLWGKGWKDPFTGVALGNGYLHYDS